MCVSKGPLCYFISILLKILIIFVRPLLPLSETYYDILTPALDFIARWIPGLQILAFPPFRTPKAENGLIFMSLCQAEN